MKKKPKLLGKILVDKNIISQEDLQEVLLLQKESPFRLGQILIKKGIATERDILSALSEHYGIPFHETIQFENPDNIFSRVPVHFLKKNRLLPFRVVKSTIFVAIIDVLDIQPLDDLKMLFPDYNLEPVLTTEDEVQRLRELAKLGERYKFADVKQAEKVLSA